MPSCHHFGEICKRGPCLQEEFVPCQLPNALHAAVPASFSYIPKTALFPISNPCDVSAGCSSSSLPSLVECMGQIQGALTVLENAPLSKTGVPSWAEHDTFTATRTLFYNLSLLDRVLEEVSKDVLLPLESLLAQVRACRGAEGPPQGGGKRRSVEERTF